MKSAVQQEGLGDMGVSNNFYKGDFWGFTQKGVGVVGWGWGVDKNPKIIQNARYKKPKTIF